MAADASLAILFGSQDYCVVDDCTSILGLAIPYRVCLFCEERPKVDRLIRSWWAVAQQDRLQLFVGPVGLPEHQVRIHKAGSWKMKSLLSFAPESMPERANSTWRSMAMPGASKLTMIPTAMRFSLLGEAEHAARRIGIEARGGYERTIGAKLRMFEVIVFQPKQARAKNDIIDAALVDAKLAGNPN